MHQTMCDRLAVVLWWFIELYSWSRFFLRTDGRTKVIQEVLADLKIVKLQNYFLLICYVFCAHSVLNLFQSTVVKLMKCWYSLKATWDGVMCWSLSLTLQLCGVVPFFRWTVWEDLNFFLERAFMLSQKWSQDITVLWPHLRWVF